MRTEARWFSLPNFVGLAPIPITSVVAFSAVCWVLYRGDMARAGYAWIVMGGTVLICVMGGTVLICVMAALGLAYSLYPYVVLNRLTVWEAAAATNSLMFVFVGVVIVIPCTIACTIFVYSIFRGKATELSYGEEP